MRTSNSNKYNSYKSAGRYTGNGFIPSKQAHKTQGSGCGALVVIVIPLLGIVAYSVLQVLS